MVKDQICKTSLADTEIPQVLLGNKKQDMSLEQEVFWFVEAKKLKQMSPDITQR